jgi:Holliday junction resolvasome RuvABC endonuclease subunit
MAYELNKIAGIDYSLCGPCICVFEGGAKFSFDDCCFYFLTDTKKYAKSFMGNIHGELFSEWNQDMERYQSIADWAVDIVKEVQQVALEGYAYSATGKVFHIAENTGVLKYKLFQEGIPVTILPPTEVKKYGSGKGNSDKNAMHQAFVKETGIDLRSIMTPDKKDVASPVSDIIDSYYICKMMHGQNMLSRI